MKDIFDNYIIEAKSGLTVSDGDRLFILNLDDVDMSRRVGALNALGVYADTIKPEHNNEALFAMDLWGAVYSEIREDIKDVYDNEDPEVEISTEEVI